jgi:hypothetical protein
LSKVAVLDPLVAQQVAAGEVVDRPASVVKGQSPEESGCFSRLRRFTVLT